MLELTLQRSGDKLIRRPIGEEPITIGRSPDNTLRLLDTEISRHHCRIEWSDGTLRVTDLSTNGTFINGSLKGNSELHAGDRLVIGPWTFHIESSIDAVPIKTIVESADATRVLQFDEKERRLTTEKIEFTVNSPDQAPIRKQLSSSTIVIGHHAACDLPVADPFVSRRHCKITCQGDQLMLFDLASTNGTYVDDVRVTKMALPHRGSFRAGKSTILYRRLRTTEQISPTKENNLGSMIGISRSMRTIFALMRKAAPSDATVCIMGESGTGKELTAREIHNLSRRNQGPFVAVNCGAVPANIIESQLFGHERGAFTGAVERTPGIFEQANGGTLFLDEIGEMPLDLQTRLLRVIESGSVKRLAGKKEIPISVRLICATNKDLKRMVAEGRFRRDLFFRIFVVPIELPTLRERKGEIPALANHLIETLATPGRSPRLSDAALKKLSKYPWPGNIRELRNVLTRSLLMTKTDLIDEKDIDIIQVKSQEDCSRGLKGGERHLLLKTLNECKWNITMTARRLKIARTSLQSKLRKHKIERP